MSRPRPVPLRLDLGGASPRGPFTLDLGGALLIAILLHAAAIWLLTSLPATGAAAPRISRLQVEFEKPRERPPERPRQQPRPRARPRPFKFVDIPDEPQLHNPNAPALSDRSRRARAPVRPPASQKPDNPDPYALGNTAQEVLTGPTRTPQAAAGAGGAGSPLPGTDAAAAGKSPPAPPAGPREGGELGSRQAPTRSGGGPGHPGGSLLSQVPRVSQSDLLESFHNPGGASPAEIGSVSFDTAAVDWGPYARQMLRVIRRNWLERFPPAASSGVRGVAAVSFRIARDGSVSGVTLVDSYGVRLSASGNVQVTPGIPPFEASSMEAIQVSELPPLPDVFTDPDVGVTIAFYYNLRPPR